jgi:hypothetical protein
MYNNNENKNLARSVVNKSAFGKTNSAYPGQNMNLSLEQVKKLVDNAEKIVGLIFTSAAGTITPNIQLPATAKFIKGFVFSGTPANTDTFELLINEERAISGAAVLSFQATNAKPSRKSYYDFVRPIASSTAINLNYTSIAGGATITLQVIYV